MARSSNRGAAAGIALPHLLKRDRDQEERERGQWKSSMHEEREFRMDGKGRNVQ